MRSYYLLTLALVVMIPAAAVALVAGAVVLVRDALERAPAAALIGLGCTLVAFGSLFLERTCGGRVNRPIITAVVGPDACRAAALGAVEVVLLLMLATALAVRLRR